MYLLFRFTLSLFFRDFDASLYLCEEAFGLLPLDTLERLAGTVMLYPYLCTLSALFILFLLVALSNLRYFFFGKNSYLQCCTLQSNKAKLCVSGN